MCPVRPGRAGAARAAISSVPEGDRKGLSRLPDVRSSTIRRLHFSQVLHSFREVRYGVGMGKRASGELGPEKRGISLLELGDADAPHLAGHDFGMCDSI